MFGYFAPGLPVSRLRQQLDAALLDQMAAALRTIQDPARSELAQLWQERPQYADWLADLEGLEVKTRLPIGAFRKPREKRQAPVFTTFAYPKVYFFDKGTGLYVFEIVQTGVENGGNTQIMVGSSGVFMAMGNNRG